MVSCSLTSLKIPLTLNQFESECFILKIEFSPAWKLSRRRRGGRGDGHLPLQRHLFNRFNFVAPKVQISNQKYQKQIENSIQSEKNKANNFENSSPIREHKIKFIGDFSGLLHGLCRRVKHWALKVFDLSSKLYDNAIEVWHNVRAIDFYVLSIRGFFTIRLDSIIQSQSFCCLVR